ncbi:MAG: hypothetical protein K2X82_20570 [Gemmataceae bacterium]|nr:hypothetical protein [Gemmataceae bacterium]
MLTRITLLAALVLLTGCGRSDPTPADPDPPAGKAAKLPPEVEFDPATAAKQHSKKTYRP